MDVEGPKQKPIEKEIRIVPKPEVKFPPINQKAPQKDWNNFDPEADNDVAYYNFDSNVPLLAYSLDK